MVQRGTVAAAARTVESGNLSTVRQIWIPRHGGPEVLEPRTAPDPEPGPGEVRIRVAAAGVNFADLLARLGLYPDAPKPPLVPGYEVAGTVDAAGSGVDRPAPGDRVVAVTRFGGYADAVTVPAGQATPLPAAIDFPAAAALPVTYLTAHMALIRMAGVRAGETVLVHGAGGGVGLAAVQVCRRRGARVIGTASAGKHERLREAGVEECIDYRTEDFEQVVRGRDGGRGVDVVLDPIGGRSWGESYRCLAPLGRLVVFGLASLAPGRRRRWFSVVKGLLTIRKYSPLSLINHNRGVYGLNLAHLWHRMDLLAAEMADVVAAVADGTYSPVIDRTFPLDRAADAHRYLHERRNFGKAVLTI